MSNSMCVSVSVSVSVREREPGNNRYLKAVMVTESSMLGKER